MKHAALIYNNFNILCRVEERPTYERAVKAGEYFTKNKGWYWYKIVETDDIDFYKAMINF